MFKWLKHLFHHHDWETLEEGIVTSKLSGGTVGFWYKQRCRICGEVRIKRVY